MKMFRGLAAVDTLSRTEYFREDLLFLTKLIFPCSDRGFLFFRYLPFFSVSFLFLFFFSLLLEVCVIFILFIDTGSHYAALAGLKCIEISWLWEAMLFLSGSPIVSKSEDGLFTIEMLRCGTGSSPQSLSSLWLEMTKGMLMLSRCLILWLELSPLRLLLILQVPEPSLDLKEMFCIPSIQRSWSGLR